VTVRIPNEKKQSTEKFADFEKRILEEIAARE
jgi:hypothetical protein